MRFASAFVTNISVLYSLLGRPLGSAFALHPFRRGLHVGRPVHSPLLLLAQQPHQRQHAVRYRGSSIASPLGIEGERLIPVSRYHNSLTRSLSRRMGAEMSSGHGPVSTPPAPEGGYPEGVTVPASEEQWRQRLTPMEYRVLREQATEPPRFSEKTPGELEYELYSKEGSKYPTAGRFDCKGCGAPLYPATTKFDSGCGWPAFYDCIPGAVTELPDADGHRIEIRCSTCGSHLGHTFKGEGFKTPTNERHCVNGVCLKYAK